MGGAQHRGLQVTRAKAKRLLASAEDFLAEANVATLTTVRPDGSPHVVVVRFTWDDDAGLARVMTVAASRKARNLTANPGGRAALCQVAGFRWITIEGTATVSDDPRRVAEGVRRYTGRYQSPPPNPPGRVVIEIAMDRVTSLNI
ncbi:MULTISPECIES: pyridoxamine 5'-phosphate oxidase family protein [unclassified Pseudofrankia]|uniref:pyridoxamine 5'-phosphate oxidase family protein n=1 Tax=unclassified Pseudofrankia TaxID=2994372 RepID=UPI0008DA101B|nr:MULTISPECIES: PPOX class F420-dependent oxidoreductase [unclassified Pseudofrankia]MDT3442861.1 PPOX class F420-dependent oxidoreductase [Pseudofrankia sp. BMG5.37]OHV74305.1 pyridoxamine 5'-phosphate oxidase [Pseudofrankia sp. BMG5.36]